MFGKAMHDYGLFVTYFLLLTSQCEGEGSLVFTCAPVLGVSTFRTDILEGLILYIIVY